MRRRQLAKALMDAPTAADRRRLLAEFRPLADETLAEQIRKACYDAWTSDPAAARRASLAANALAKTNPIDDVRANALWVAGVAAITAGKFDVAIENLAAARKLFTRLRRKSESAQTYVPTLVALALSGRSDEAVRAGATALRQFIGMGDDLAAGKVEMNLSNIAARRSRWREAERRALSALRLFETVGERTWQAMAQNDIALTYMELTDLARAEHFFGLALEMARSEKMLATEAEIEASMGNLAVLRGRYADALKHLELSRRKYEKLALPHQTAVADLEIADIYAVLNLHAEAYDIYARVSDAFRRFKMSHEEARSRLGFGRTAISLRDLPVARRELERAAKLFKADGNSSGAAAILLLKASLEQLAERHVRVSELLREARKAGRNSPRLLLAADVLEGDSFRQAGASAKAKRLLERALATAERSGQPGFARTAAASLAEMAVRNGDHRLAENLYSSAITATEQMRDSLAPSDFSLTFLADKLDAYEGLANLYVSRGEYARAFVVTENSRSRSLLDSMAQPLRDREHRNELHDQLNELRAELNLFYKRLESGESQDLRSDITRRERAIAAVGRQIKSVSKRAATRRISMEVDDLGRELGADRTFVEYAESGGGISAYVVRNGEVSYVPEICSVADVAAGLDELHFQFGSCRSGPLLAKFGDQLKQRADVALAALYEMLIGPIEHLLGGREIIFTPSGSLNFVPFPALVSGGKYLIERFQVGHVPSAQIWSHLRKRRPRGAEHSLLVGFADERIPMAESEIDALGKRPGKKLVLKGDDATFSAFSAAAEGHDVIHLACHGQFRLDNPMYSSLHLADGWITARDLLELKLRARLVTLSACESGMSGTHAGSEPLGLVWGFLAAGASSLIVSLWAVSDRSAPVLMSDLYDELQRGASPSASLRKAQLRSIERGDHPYFWAPFIAVGK